MHTPRLHSPLSAVAAGAILLVAAACNGPLAHNAGPTQAPVSAPVVVAGGGQSGGTPAPQAPASTTSAGSDPAAPPTASAAPVRTDDLEAGLHQADAQLSQTSSAVSTADLPAPPGSD